MSQPASSFKIPTWVDSSLLQGMLRGIERESLRMQSNGFLSQQPHPSALGSALMHSRITTDYSEALMEFITPPKETIPAVLAELRDIHAVVHRHLPEGERLWPLSMPCMLDDDEDQIPLANYGSSNVGRFKTLYRRGLGVRYGRRMQTISGLHYNLSFPDALFEALHAHETDPALQALNAQDYRSHRYFGLIRNFIRLTPLVIFLVGASPSVCRCFLTNREHHLKSLIKGTMYLPDATALRMGRLGYQNSAQKKLGIHYNDLNGYLAGIQQAVKTPYAPFTNLGLTDANGEPTQINDHILQIENEYYSLVRPKQVPQSGETPSEALKHRGVGYVELRAIDINPYSPIGVDEQTAALLEALALYCLLLPSPAILPPEQDLIERNQDEVVNRGRSSEATIETLSGKVSLKNWIAAQLKDMQAAATLLDNFYESSMYQNALDAMLDRSQLVEKTLSARVIQDTLAQQGTWNMGYTLAGNYAEYYNEYELSIEKAAYFEQLALQSLQQQYQLEQESSVSFSDYLAQYQ